jgi:tetratricopeptide (TPR) repeat protein
MHLGHTALRAGRHAEAEQEFQAAHKYVRDAADSRLASTLSCLAITHAVRGDEENAAAFAIGALDLLRDLGSSTALSEGLEAAEMLAELWSILDKPEAEDLWIRIATFWEGPAASLPERAGGLTALGFRHRQLGDVSEAVRYFEKAAKLGGIDCKQWKTYPVNVVGVGALGALRGLIAVHYKSGGGKAAEPSLECLVDYVEGRFGQHHSLFKTVLDQLRVSYTLLGEQKKLAQLDLKYK